MEGVRTPALIAAGIFATMLLAIFAGDVVIAAGVVKNPSAFQTPAKIVFFTLFVAFGFSLVPLMVKLVLGFQVIIGNGNLAPVKAAISHSALIVGVLWALMAAGLAVGLPAAIRQGFFNNDSLPASSVSSDSQAAEAIANMPVQGTLVAAPGMQVRRMLQESSLKVRSGSKSPLFSGAQFGSAAIFDYRVANTATIFRRCRYYYITTYAGRPLRIEGINVGISPEKMTRDDLKAAERIDRRRLKSDGWRSSDGRTWLRGGIILNLRERRIDDPVPGENPARAGEWIQYVELREARGR
ncbi:MAG: hypothetical protein WB609_00770 [Candidatus Cybelea sp.]